MGIEKKTGGIFYRPELDCLRFFAFLFVFISHAFSQESASYEAMGLPTAAAHWVASAINSGGYGVALFFLLSSYLITELLLRECDRSGHLKVSWFYARRILRIWPLYFAFILITFLIVPQNSIYALKKEFLLPMILLVGNWAVVFYQGMGYSVAGPLWSISVEEQFYLVWPLVLSALGIRQLKRLCFLLIILANVIRVVMEKKGAGWVTFWCSTFTWVDTIAAGALLAIWLHHGAPRFAAWQRVALGFAGLFIWIAGGRYQSIFVYPDIAHYPLILAGSILMLLSVLGSTLTSRVLIFLGRISYGLYVFHLAMLTLVWFVFGKFTLTSAAAGLVLTILAAALSYYLLEQPFLRLKKRFTRVQSQPITPQDLDPIASEPVSPTR